MPDNDRPSQPPAQTSSNRWSSIFALPGPLRELFNHFPLITYAANPLPAGTNALPSSSENALYIFATPSDASRGLPSLNPTCLKHQTYLRLKGVEVRTIVSNNHASPSGSLPFLLPTKGAKAVPASGLRKWAEGGTPYPAQAKLDVHLALLDHRLRRAWLYQLYLDPANVPALSRLYLETASSVEVVRYVTHAQLRKAAGEELRNSSGPAGVEEAELLAQGVEALGALNELLSSGGGTWFSSEDEPGWLDAAVFAYTGPLLDRRMEWARNGLGDALKDMDALMRHRQGIAKRCGWDDTL
ncbi:hypothetical protein ANO11243_039360 [Dothideomycetidae sp. 11243]|nr:hypothetical protein ANO11243_039360 [fungal sp. No.11243]